MFAKLFETPETQVLVYIQRGDEPGAGPKVYRILELDDVTIGVNLSWHDDDDGWDKAQKYFDEFDQKQASELVPLVKNLLLAAET